MSDEQPTPLVAGEPESPVVLHVPHSSRAIPPDVRRRIVLDDDALERELDLMTDTATERIAAECAAQVGVPPWRWVNPWSRLVVDPERFPDERERMRAVGMGPVYTATHDRGVLREDDPAHEADLLARFFAPYTEGLQDLVSERLTMCGAAVIIDLHSYPEQALAYELGRGKRPQVCLGTDGSHTPPWLEHAAREAFGDGESPLDVALDTPFAGTYVPAKHYERDPRVVSVMVELRRDTYLDDLLRPTDGLGDLAGRLGDLVDTVTAHLALE